MGNQFGKLTDYLEPRHAAKLERASRQERKRNGRVRFARYSRRPWNSNHADYKPNN